MCREERKKEKQRRRALLETEEGKEERERRKMKKKKKEEKEKRKKNEQGTAEVEDDCSANKCRRPTGKQVRIHLSSLCICWKFDIGKLVN